MKKLLLTLSIATFAFNSFAQQIQDDFGTISTPTFSQNDNQTDFAAGVGGGAAQKTTGLTDSLIFSNSFQRSGPFVNAYYDKVTPIDSGRVFGMNTFGYKAFAQLYRFASIDAVAPADTTYNILGVYALFVGTVNSPSSKSITINIWKRDAVKYAIPSRPKFFVYGVPSTVVASKTVGFSALTLNSLKAYYLTAPLTGVNYDIYAGYSLPSYTYSALGGDTVGVAADTNRNAGTYTIESGTNDSLINTNTLVQNSAGAWKSSAFELGKTGDIILYPIIKLSCATCGVGVRGFNQNGLTFFGNYPNPAVNSTNIKFALKSNADVTIYVSDMSGKTISTTKETGLAIGDHVVQINTSNLAAGNYSYLVVTSKGDGIASEFTIVK